MPTNKEKLINYLLDSNLENLDSKEIHVLIKSLNVTDIFDALREAQEIQKNLSETSLGRILL